jgi:ribosomal protein S18 acetylase RimI-like enzyme
VTEVQRLGSEQPPWLARLDADVFGQAWGPSAAHEEAWGIPEAAFARWALIPAAGEAELLRIAVAEEARGQGLGRLLLEACQADLAAQGLTHLFLEVRASNTYARRLYRQCGWEICGERPRYYPDGEDAVLYQRLG